MKLAKHSFKMLYFNPPHLCSDLVGTFSTIPRTPSLYAQLLLSDGISHLESSLPSDNTFVLKFSTS